MPNRQTLSRSAINVARIHRDELVTAYTDLPGRFKMKDALETIDDWHQGIFLKLRQSGLLDSEDVHPREAKDWYLTDRAKRWLRQECDDIE